MPLSLIMPDKTRQVGTSLAERVQLPAERVQARPDHAAIMPLLERIAACPDEQGVHRLAIHLRRAELDLLCLNLLEPPVVASPQLQQRILTILIQRRTPSLASLAWHYFQQHFPDPVASQLMTDICPVLQKQDPPLPCAVVLDGLPISPRLPAQMARRMAESLARLYISRNNSQIDGNGVKNPGPAVRPDRTGRRFEPFLWQKTMLQQWLIQHTIVPRSPYADALLSEFFAICPDSEIIANTTLFRETLQRTDLNNQVMILDHYLQQPRLESEWEPINLAMLDQFGSPPPLTRLSLFPPDSAANATTQVQSAPGQPGATRQAPVQPASGLSGSAQPGAAYMTSASAARYSSPATAASAAAGSSAASLQQEQAAQSAPASQPKRSIFSFIANLFRRKPRPDPWADLSSQDAEPSRDNQSTSLPSEPLQSVTPALDANDDERQTDEWTADGQRGTAGRAAYPASTPETSSGHAAHSAGTLENAASNSGMNTSDTTPAANPLVASHPSSSTAESSSPPNEDTTAPIWRQVKIQTVLNFFQWELQYQIKNHIGEAPAKSRFYRLIQDQIISLTVRADGDMVVRSRYFYLIDRQGETDFLLYYDNPTYEMLLDRGDETLDLFSPDLPVTESRNVILDGTWQNVVRLNLVEVDGLYARDFIREALLPPARRNIIRLMHSL